MPKMMSFVGDDTRQEWLVIFAIAATVIFVCFIFFTITVDANEERYNGEIQDPEIDDIASAIEDVVNGDGENKVVEEIVVMREKTPRSTSSETESDNSYSTCSS